MKKEKSNAVLMVEAIVRGLCNDQSKIVISEHALTTSTTIVIQVAQPDHGRVLGSRRVMLDAIRSLAKIAGLNEGLICRVELMEPVPVKRGEHSPYVPAEDWDSEGFEAILDCVLKAVFVEQAVWDKSTIAGINTVYEVRIGATDPMVQMLPTLRDHFETIFHAIGKGMHHTVHIDLVAKAIL